MIVSVVAPTHQRPQLLLRLLRALEEQTLEKNNFEVIIIPSPGDPGIKVIEKFKENSKLNLRTELPSKDPWQGKNVSFKRNYGAKCAVSPWIAFIDDDCSPTPEWLESALPYFENKNYGGIEGKTITPQGGPRTLTWKGMQRLANFGGYQTCNIFYRKDLFSLVGGFDEVGFPWYLEDSDLAWSILDTDHQIAESEGSVVIHPVGAPAPWRLIHEAKGMGLKVLLYKKHPEIYVLKGTKALRKYHYVYLFFFAGLIQSLVLGHSDQFYLTLSFFILVIGLHMFKIFRKVDTSAKEVFGVCWRMVLAPPIALWSTIRALFKHRCSLRESLFLLNPF